MNASLQTSSKIKTAYQPPIDPRSATVEEIDDWILALGGREISPDQSNDMVRSVDWLNVPGENPVDPEFPFAERI